jgi:hypothetical protein
VGALCRQCQLHQHKLSDAPEVVAEPAKVVDMVNHPPHYNIGIETSDYIESWDMGWNEANVVKYITRYKYKNGLDDLYKAQAYLGRLITRLEKQLKHQ